MFTHIRIYHSLIPALFFLTSCASTQHQQAAQERATILAQLGAQQQQLAAQLVKIEAQELEQTKLSAELADIGEEIDLIGEVLLDFPVPNAQVPAAPVRSEAVVKPSQGTASSETLVSRRILGRVEWAYLDVIGYPLKARIDTGAKSSSLSAAGIQFFERDGVGWVRFFLPRDPEQKRYERPVVRVARIRKSLSDDIEERPTIKLMVQVGGSIDEAEFTLTNREDLSYPVVLGRNFLQDVFLVDVGKSFTMDKNALMAEVNKR